MTGRSCGIMKLKKIHAITLGLLLLVFVAGASASAMTVNSISPGYGTRGTTGTYYIYGSGFNPGIQYVDIVSESQPYDAYAYVDRYPTIISPNTIRCTFTIPTNAPTGYYFVGVFGSIDNNGGKHNAFTVYPYPPTISQIYPTHANQGTSGTFDIYGSGFFQTGAQVEIQNSLGYTYYATGETTLNSGQIHCTLAIPTTALIGNYTVRVRNPDDALYTKANAFTVYAQTPTISYITPPSATPGTTPAFYIYGSGFQPGAEVEFSSGSTTYSAGGETLMNSGLLRCYLQIPTSAPTGAYTVRVRNAGGTTWGYKVNALTVNGVITVTSPNGGENWMPGTDHLITWSYIGNQGSKVKIVLTRGSLTPGIQYLPVIINSSVPLGSFGKGSYLWKIPSNQATGTLYKITVQSTTLPIINDTSNDYFTIPPHYPSITTTSPNGGESWQRGTPHTVTWSYTGNPGSDVKIVLYKAGNPVGTATYSTSIGLNGKGSYPWTISSTREPGSDYQIVVQSVSQPAIKDYSDKYFTITSAPTPTPSITVTSPNGGEIWKRGTPHTITWKYTGNPGPYVKIELLKGGTPVGTATYSTSLGSGGIGSYLWKISSERAPGTDYRIRVTSVSQPTVYDTSNGDFTIIS
jgi:hypothetical protein